MDNILPKVIAQGNDKKHVMRTIVAKTEDEEQDALNKLKYMNLIRKSFQLLVML